MSTSPDPRREQPSTYFVADRTNQEELSRLRIQDQMVTATMGGLLPEQPGATIFQRVLDVGCGTGNWLIEMAKTHPDTSLLIGVDASKKYVEYGRAQAEAEQVSDRVEFHVMDALRMLEFPSNYFNLVNHRFGLGWLRTWEWRKLLQEYRRITRPGGIVRITEGDLIVESSSQALLHLNDLTIEAFYNAGHFFTKSSSGLTSQLAQLLDQHGLKDVQTHIYIQELRAGTTQGQLYIEDMYALYKTIIPFIRKWGRMPDDYETLYQQMVSELQEPDFVAKGRLLTVWGEAPQKNQRSDN